MGKRTGIYSVRRDFDLRLLTWKRQGFRSHLKGVSIVFLGENAVHRITLVSSATIVRKVFRHVAPQSTVARS